MTNRIVVTTQAELDALPDKFAEYTVIEIRSPETAWITVSKARESSHVEARESSHVVARESSHVVARESSHVVAWGSSHVEARESSHVVAWESSHVVAWGSSHVEAWESSHVEAWESSHVEARESSHVVAWGSSHVEAWGSVGVHVKSSSVTAALYSFAVAWLLVQKAKVVCKQKTARIVRPKRKPGASGWLEDNALSPKGGKVVLFKRVSKDWKTQEGTAHETTWEVGSRLTHPAWDPKTSECGAGKFHACSTPYFCDEFRSKAGDRYVAIEVKVRDLYAWPNGDYPHKIAFRSGRVLHEVDRFGVAR